MLDKIGVELFYDKEVELLYQKFVFFLFLWEFQFVFFGISDDIFADEIFKFVSVFKIGVLTYNAVDSVGVKIFSQLFKIWSNFGINCFLFLFFLGFI